MMMMMIHMLACQEISNAVAREMAIEIRVPVLTDLSPSIGVASGTWADSTRLL
jgi:hypothetical protein